MAYVLLLQCLATQAQCDTPTGCRPTKPLHTSGSTAAANLWPSPSTPLAATASRLRPAAGFAGAEPGAIASDQDSPGSDIHAAALSASEESEPPCEYGLETSEDEAEQSADQEPEQVLEPDSEQAADADAEQADSDIEIVRARGGRRRPGDESEVDDESDDDESDHASITRMPLTKQCGVEMTQENYKKFHLIAVNGDGSCVPRAIATCDKLSALRVPSRGAAKALVATDRETLHVRQQTSEYMKRFWAELNRSGNFGLPAAFGTQFLLDDYHFQGRCSHPCIDAKCEHIQPALRTEDRELRAEMHAKDMILRDHHCTWVLDMTNMYFTRAEILCAALACGLQIHVVKRPVGPGKYPDGLNFNDEPLPEPLEIHNRHSASIIYLCFNSKDHYDPAIYIEGEEGRQSDGAVQPPQAPAAAAGASTASAQQPLPATPPNQLPATQMQQAAPAPSATPPQELPPTQTQQQLSPAPSATPPNQLPATQMQQAAPAPSATPPQELPPTQTQQQLSPAPSATPPNQLPATQMQQAAPAPSATPPQELPPTQTQQQLSPAPSATPPNQLPATQMQQAAPAPSATPPQELPPTQTQQQLSPAPSATPPNQLPATQMQQAAPAPSATPPNQLPATQMQQAAPAPSATPPQELPPTQTQQQLSPAPSATPPNQLPATQMQQAAPAPSATPPQELPPTQTQQQLSPAPSATPPNQLPATQMQQAAPAPSATPPQELPPTQTQQQLSPAPSATPPNQLPATQMQQAAPAPSATPPQELPPRQMQQLSPTKPQQAAAVTARSAQQLPQPTLANNLLSALSNQLREISLPVQLGAAVTADSRLTARAAQFIYERFVGLGMSNGFTSQQLFDSFNDFFAAWLKVAPQIKYVSMGQALTVQLSSTRHNGLFQQLSVRETQHKNELISFLSTLGSASGKTEPVHPPAGVRVSFYDNFPGSDAHPRDAPRNPAWYGVALPSWQGTEFEAVSTLLRFLQQAECKDKAFLDDRVMDPLSPDEQALFCQEFGVQADLPDDAKAAQLLKVAARGSKVSRRVIYQWVAPATEMTAKMKSTHSEWARKGLEPYQPDSGDASAPGWIYADPARTNANDELAHVEAHELALGRNVLDGLCTEMVNPHAPALLALLMYTTARGSASGRRGNHVETSFSAPFVIDLHLTRALRECKTHSDATTTFRCTPTVLVPLDSRAQGCRFLVPVEESKLTEWAGVKPLTMVTVTDRTAQACGIVLGYVIDIAQGSLCSVAKGVLVGIHESDEKWRVELVPPSALASSQHVKKPAVAVNRHTWAALFAASGLGHAEHVFWASQFEHTGVLEAQLASQVLKEYVRAYADAIKLIGDVQTNPSAVPPAAAISNSRRTRSQRSGTRPSMVAAAAADVINIDSDDSDFDEQESDGDTESDDSDEDGAGGDDEQINGGPRLLDGEPDRCAQNPVRRARGAPTQRGSKPPPKKMRKAAAAVKTRATKRKANEQGVREDHADSTTNALVAATKPNPWQHMVDGLRKFIQAVARARPGKTLRVNTKEVEGLYRDKFANKTGKLAKHVKKLLEEAHAGPEDIEHDLLEQLIAIKASRQETVLDLACGFLKITGNTRGTVVTNLHASVGLEDDTAATDPSSPVGYSNSPRNRKRDSAPDAGADSDPSPPTLTPTPMTRSGKRARLGVQAAPADGAPGPVQSGAHAAALHAREPQDAQMSAMATQINALTAQIARMTELHAHSPTALAAPTALPTAPAATAPTPSPVPAATAPAATGTAAPAPDAAAAPPPAMTARRQRAAQDTGDDHGAPPRTRMRRAASPRRDDDDAMIDLDTQAAYDHTTAMVPQAQRHGQTQPHHQLQPPRLPPVPTFASPSPVPPYHAAPISPYLQAATPPYHAAPMSPYQAAPLPYHAAPMQAYYVPPQRTAMLRRVGPGVPHAQVLPRAPMPQPSYYTQNVLQDEDGVEYEVVNYPPRPQF